VTAVPPDVAPAPHAWLALLALGALHGINPAMGWLFAVGAGLQARDRRAVWGALGPLALGHALAIGAAVLLAASLGLVVPPGALRWGVAAVLVGFGVLRLVRHRHVRWGGMRMDARELTVWSFLMASAHGAGLMVLPLVLGAAPGDAHHHHGADGLGAAAPLIHTVGYLAVTGVLAVVVYEKVGLRILRRAWLNLDPVWAAALMATGIGTMLF
jgi:hypothetical protein